MPLNKSVYATVSNHSRRWIRADIRFSPGNEESLRSLEDLSVPILRHLQIEYVTWKNSPTFVLDLFRDHLPELTSLALVDVTMRRWSSPIFGTHIYSLQLAGIRTSGPTREEFHNIPRACPKLTHLELVNVVFSGEIPQGSRVRLAGLQTVILKPVSASDVFDIGKMVETPHCNNYSIETRDPIVLCAVTLQVRPLFEACIASGSNLGVHVDGYWVCMLCRGSQAASSSNFELRLGCVASCGKILDWINSMLAILRPPLSHPHRCSPRLSSVRSLTITDYYGYTNRLVEALSIPVDLGDGGHKWLWPNLQEVTVTAFNGPSMILLHMVKTRTEAALRQKESRALDEIATLLRLEVEAGVSIIEEFEAFRAILGDIAVMKLHRWWEK
ncbi:hypothetical protein FRB94_006095 [Tulasnella sp. JGI-2019a]|nr:hypothetical protein FRB94_006095 [Tulasnella sp. JGI-2019a]